MSPPLSPLAAAGQVMCNRISLVPLRAQPRRRDLHPVELAIGTVLSQPLRPAMPEPSPHPLRFGWIFESLELTDAEQASVKLHSPGSLVRLQGGE